MSTFNHASSLLAKQPFGTAPSQRDSLASAATLPGLYSPVGSAESLNPATTLPLGSSAERGLADPILLTHPRGSSATTLPPPFNSERALDDPFSSRRADDPFSSRPSPRLADDPFIDEELLSSKPDSSSGLFGKSRPPGSSDSVAIRETIPVDLSKRKPIPLSSTATRATIPVSAAPPADLARDRFPIYQNPLAAGLAKPPADLKRDPFLIDLKESASQPNEGTPLFPVPDSARNRSRSRGRVMADDAKLLILPVSCCMLIQTSVSAAVLWLSFDETGHRHGYEEGHLDPEDQHAGCQAAYFWLLLQAGIDLLITIFTCILLLFPIESDPVGFHGCVAALRVCTLSAGFHVLYFSGLQRDLCDQPLIIWSTIIIWLGMGIMALTILYLAHLLLTGTSKQRRQLPFAPRPKTQEAPDRYRSMPMYATVQAQQSKSEPTSKVERGFSDGWS